jgi:hypothetical protein
LQNCKASADPGLGSGKRSALMYLEKEEQDL